MASQKAQHCRRAGLAPWSAKADEASTVVVPVKVVTCRIVLGVTLSVNVQVPVSPSASVMPPPKV